MSRISRISIGFVVCCSVCSLGSALRAQSSANAQAAQLKAQIDDLTLQLAALRDENEMLQTERAKFQAEEQSRLQVYRLQHVDVDSAAQIIHGLVAKNTTRIAKDGRANSLIVKAPADTHETLAALLNEIDRPEAVKSPEERLVVKQYDIPEDVLNVLTNTLAESVPKARVRSVQHKATNGVLVVEAPVKAHTDIREYIRHLELDSKRDKTQLLRVVWLMSDSGDQDDVPDDVKPAIAELEKFGVNKMSVAAQSIIQTSISTNFEASCVAHPSGLNEPCQLIVDGTFQDTNRLQISLRATQRSSQGRGSSDLARIDTTITIPIGHPVVLGVNPVGERTSAFLITVRD